MFASKKKHEILEFLALMTPQKRRKALGLKCDTALKFNLEIYLGCDKNYNDGIILICARGENRKANAIQQCALDRSKVA